jgi:hypothetical protein
VKSSRFDAISCNFLLYLLASTQNIPSCEYQALSKDIADKIKDKCIATLNIPRYKIVVQVTIGQMKDQGVTITSRCLWDTATDNYATARFQNQLIWSSAVVFGLHTD